MENLEEKLMIANARIFDLERELANWRKLGDINHAAEVLATSEIKLQEVTTKLEYYKDRYAEKIAECKRLAKISDIVYCMVEFGIDDTIKSIKNGDYDD